MSNRLLRRYLQRNDWETDVARYGIDIWMTTIAISEGFRVCQSFLGAKLHDAKDPGADLSAMLHQVVGSVFQLMEEYEPVWAQRIGSQPADLFGFRFDVGLDPVPVDVSRMTAKFRHGCEELREIWSIVLQPQTRAAVMALAGASARDFHLGDDLWVRVIYDFACGYHRRVMDRGHLLRSLTPLYLARVASFVLETEHALPAEVDESIERLCRSYEEMKPYLVCNWNRRALAATGTAAQPVAEEKEVHRD